MNCFLQLTNSHKLKHVKQTWNSIVFKTHTYTYANTTRTNTAKYNLFESHRLHVDSIHKVIFP